MSTSCRVVGRGMKYLDEETITRLVVEVFTSAGDLGECGE